MRRPTEGAVRGPAPLPPRGPLPLRFADQVCCAVAAAVALVLMAGYCFKVSGWGTAPIELDRQSERSLEYQIDLNEASWVEWSQLPGIGPTLAHRIVDDRRVNGPFRDLDDLDRVNGIGRQRIEAVRPYVRVPEPARNIADRSSSSGSP